MVVYNIYLYVFFYSKKMTINLAIFCFVNDLVILCIHRMRVFYKTRRLLEPANDHSSLLFKFIFIFMMLSHTV